MIKKFSGTTDWYHTLIYDGVHFAPMI